MGKWLVPYMGMLVSHYFCVAGDNIDDDAISSGMAWESGMCNYFLVWCCNMVKRG